MKSKYEQYLDRYEFSIGTGYQPTPKPLTEGEYGAAEQEFQQDYEAAWERADYAAIARMENALAL